MVALLITLSRLLALLITTHEPLSIGTQTSTSTRPDGAGMRKLPKVIAQVCKGLLFLVPGLHLYGCILSAWCMLEMLEGSH